ncbi:hypothetical protein RB195_002960 [Necator americanus]|uniref:ShKT domain-containing protein n=1 Tax=Necator americanus TaxID=51031 RepID=A0ABR1DMR9_NECAM
MQTKLLNANPTPVDPLQHLLKMLPIHIFSVLIARTLAAIVDENCTYNDGGTIKYSERAVVCRNVVPDKVCAKLYAGRNPTAHSPDDRDPLCYKYGADVDDDFRQTAIKNCPRDCGYCCLTPEYNCENKQFPRISCSLITRDMCFMTIWKEIIAEDCPNVCGFCKSGDCSDKVNDCERDITICRKLEMQEFVKENCRKTCGYCTDPTTAPSSSECGQEPSCDVWVTNGFCNNPHYTVEQKKKHCGRLCGLC